MKVRLVKPVKHGLSSRSNVKVLHQMVTQFLDSLPDTFASTRDIHSSTGAAMQAALKLLVGIVIKITAVV